MTQVAVIAKNAVRSVQHHSPVILTGLAVAGVISTTALAVKATSKATKMIQEFENKDNEIFQIKSTLLEKVKLVWPLYIPTAATGVVTIASIIGAQSINARRQAALIGAFTLTETAFQEYKDQALQELGKTKEERLTSQVAQNQVDANPPSDEFWGARTEGDQACLDTYTGRYFWTTVEKLRAAQNDINESLIDGELYMSLNEFYHAIGLDECIAGEQVGFSAENRVQLKIDTVMAPGGRPCLALGFRALPRQDYRSMFQ